jgi:MFS family permease
VEIGLGKTPSIFYGWVVLSAAFIIIVLGYAIRNTFSVFYPVIVEGFGWGRGNTALMFSISILVYGLTAPLVGSLVDRFEPRLVLALGACVMGGGIALCSLATAQWQFYLLYGVMVAIGLSVAGWTPLTTIISNWFVKKRGLVFGILGAGFGMSLISASIAQFLISSFGWQTSYVIIGIFSTAVIVPLCTILIRRHPRDKGLLPDGIPGIEAKPQSLHESRAATSSERKWSNTSWTLSRAAKTPQFWLLFLISFLHQGFAEQVAIAHQVYFLRDVGYGPMQAATIYSAFGVAFVVGNLCSSFSDSLGREKVYIPSCLIGSAAICLLFLIRDISQPWMPFLSVIGLGLGLGTAVPVFYAAVADLFHGKYFGAIQGSMILGFSLGGALSPWLAGFLHDKTGRYTVTFVIVLASLLVAAVLMWLVAPRKLRPVPSQAKYRP